MNIIRRAKHLNNQIRTSQEDLDLLNRLSSRRGQREYALEVLGLSGEDIRNIKSLNREGPKRFAMNQLGINSRNQLDKIKNWMGLSRAERIEKLSLNSDSNMRDFLNQSYAEHRRRKKKHKNNWKYKTFTQHMDKILSKLHQCQASDTMTLSDAKYIVTQLYYAFWVASNGVKDIIIKRQEAMPQQAAAA